MASRIKTAPRRNDLAGLNRAAQLVERGDCGQAEAICEQLLKKHPKVPAVWGVLSAAQLGLGRFEAARRSAQQGLKHNPKSVELRMRLGLALSADFRYGEAVDAFEHALRLRPGDERASRALAEAHSRLGHDDEAVALLAPLVAAEDPAPPRLAMVYLRVCLRAGRLDEGRAVVDALTAGGDMPPGFRAQAQFLIGELHERSGRHDEAFKAYQLANSAAERPYSAERNREGVDRMIEAWTPGAVAGLERPSRKSDRFVFIVGMPRSGTSLVEQIIASHRRAFGCGELEHINDIAVRLTGSRDGWAPVHQMDRLTPGVLDAASGAYANSLRQIAPGADLITDKMPLNAMHLGLISAIFPGARIVHCVRDPRDTCWSCFTHHFMGRGNAFTNDLADLGDYFADHHRLMAHWKSALDIAIHDVVYEDLVRDPEAQSRELIGFLGLGWDERCLRFYENKRTVRTNSAEQVRRPVHEGSIGRWKPYESHLAPLIERLPAGSLRG